MSAEDLARLAEQLPVIIRGALQESEVALQGLAGRHMGLRATTGTYQQGGNNAFANKTKRNPTDKLRIATGILFRSLAKGGPLSISRFSTSNGQVEWIKGSGVKYANIHERGGVIAHPGGTPYIVTDQGAVFIRKDTAMTTDRQVFYTKAHLIIMPARPYLRPALQEFFDTNELTEMVRDKLKEVLG